MLEAIFTETTLTVTLTGLFQWDYGQKLYIKGVDLEEVSEVHFSNSKEKEAMVMPATKEGDYVTCLIPDVLLTKSLDITAWVYDIKPTSGETVRTIILKVEPRTKPQNFVETYPDAEVILEDVLNKINQNIADNAEFKEEITEIEQEHANAEALRVQAEQGRVQAENLRVQAEDDREAAEGLRDTAEGLRDDAEQARVLAEQGRVTAENTRVSNESTRQSQESTRQSNESTRQSNETTRESEWQELKADIEQTLQQGVVNDTVTSTTQTWSSQKISTELAGKASSDHTHDDRYYTETEADERFAALNHNHDSSYYKKTETYSASEIDEKLGDIDFSTLATKEQVGNLNYKALSQTEYDGLATKDANTIYFIYEDES